MRRLTRIFRLPLRSRRLVRKDADDELASFIDERVDYFVARGMAPDEAEAEALRRLGAPTDRVYSALHRSAERRERRLGISDALADLRSDIHFALRSLVKRSPGWTVVALLTMALGFGATTTMLRVADALLIRPINYRHAGRVFVARRTVTIGDGTGLVPLPLAIVPQWRDYARSIEDLAPFGRQQARLVVGADSLLVSVALVDTGFLHFTGARPLIGQNIAPRQIWLSEDFWRRQYGGSRDVIGKAVRFDGEPCTIAGVVPASLALPDINVARPDVWATLRPDGYTQGVAVRLRPGISSTVATKELASIFAQSKLDTPDPLGMKWRLTLSRPEDGLAFRHALIMLIGAVMLLLLVACTNLTNLLVARGVSRQQELAVRSALGAGHARLLRQLLTECLVLAVGGTACAAFVGWLGLRFLAAARPATLIPLSHVSADRSVLSVALVLAVASALAIGLVSALRSVRRDVAQTLQRRAASAPNAGRLRDWLVVGEVAMSATLLVGALLLVHAVYRLQQTRLGFNEHGLYEVWYGGPNMPPNRLAFATLLRDRATHVPGVERVTVAESVLPFAGRSWFALSTFETPETLARPDAPRTGTAVNRVQPDYFLVMGIRLLAGHTFDAGSRTRNEVIVNHALAATLWPGGDPIGRHFRNVVPRPGQPVEPWQTVIAVATDVVSDLIKGDAQPILYQPLDDQGSGPITLIARVDDVNANLARDQFTALREPGWPRPLVLSVRRSVDESLAEPHFTMLILVTFAAFAVLLTAIGLFGVISYSVARRTNEIGVRMALGATRATIARLVLGDGVRLALTGMVLGLAGAAAGTRIIQSMLYGVSHLDPFAFGVGATLLLVVSIAACLVPLARATAVNPAVAMRAD